MGELLQGPWPTPDAATLPILAVCNWQRVTARTVRRWMEDGLPYEPDADGLPRFNPTKVQAFLAERRGRKAS